MIKGLWVVIGLLVLALAWLVSVKVLYKADSSLDATSAANTKVMMSLDKFSGYHHDADILLKELTKLRSDTQIAIESKDIKLLARVINNSYRVMDNININRLPTIKPFEVCDEALDSLSRYATSAKTYYANPNDTDVTNVDKLQQDFDSKFTACQSIVNDKPVEALYQDYQ